MPGGRRPGLSCPARGSCRRLRGRGPPTRPRGETPPAPGWTPRGAYPWRGPCRPSGRRCRPGRAIGAKLHAEMACDRERAMATARVRITPSGRRTARGSTRSAGRGRRAGTPASPGSWRPPRPAMPAGRPPRSTASWRISGALPAADLDGRRSPGIRIAAPPEDRDRGRRPDALRTHPGDGADIACDTVPALLGGAALRFSLCASAKMSHGVLQWPWSRADPHRFILRAGLWGSLRGRRLAPHVCVQGRADRNRPVLTASL
jgi:hypothetical protein